MSETKLTPLHELESKLKPCPFCRGNSLTFFGAVHDTHHTMIRCNNCRALVVHSDGGNALNVWERRADLFQPIRACPSCGGIHIATVKAKYAGRAVRKCSQCNNEWEESA